MILREGRMFDYHGTVSCNPHSSRASAMLVSHRKKFIYTKTIKTAGTSVESYFEQYCMPEGEWKESHSREEYVSETGIIGYRGPNRKGLTWYNHMPARKILKLVGPDIWESYYKFTVVRNPFDKLISEYFMLDYRKKNRSLIEKISAMKRRILKRESPIDRVKGKTEVERFRSWIQEGGGSIDRDKYIIGGQVCVDYFIRFDDLHEGLKHVCNNLRVPFEYSRIPKFKSGYRHQKIKIHDYYSKEIELIVKKKYAWELERFGYSLSEGHPSS